MLQGSEFVRTKALFTWVAQSFCMQLSVQAWNLKKGPKLALLAVQKCVQFRRSGSYKYILVQLVRWNLASFCSCKNLYRPM